MGKWRRQHDPNVIISAKDNADEKDKDAKKKENKIQVIIGYSRAKVSRLRFR